MADVEEQLEQNEAVATTETEVTLPASKSTKSLPVADVSRKPSIYDKRPKGKRKVVGQVMGKCDKCGYLSSQKICKACMLLEGLNKNRPQTAIEVSVEDEESSTTLMRQVGRLQLHNE